MQKQLKLKYYSPAKNDIVNWEKYSLPIGNGYAGASIFGGVNDEKIQITTNEFANTFSLGGVSNFAEINILSNGKNYSNYERGLTLDYGIVYSKYTEGENEICRSAFYNYLSNVFVYKIDTKNKKDFTIELVIPYLNSRSVSEGCREGSVYIKDNSLVMEGKLNSRDLLFYGKLCVVVDGKAKYIDNKIYVENSKSVEIYYCFKTSYKLCKEVFFDDCNKAIGEKPNDIVESNMTTVLEKGYKKLFDEHCKDYSSLMGRVNFSLGGIEDNRSTEELLLSVKNGNFEPYLEEVYYMFGRHLLVSSSRKGTLPASLQGVWSMHDKSPWGSGFWHNINIQMNYWPAFSTNLEETFLAYVDFCKAYLPKARKNAEELIKLHNPENYIKDKCGWIIGTGAFAYEIGSIEENTHSGPGTGGLTTKLFADYYDYTKDENVLKQTTFPIVHEMSMFLTKCVRNYDGRYLCSFSASPEQILSGDIWVNEHKNQQYYHTVGCSFDQQLIYENCLDDLRFAKELNYSDEIIEKEKDIIDKLEPVRIGYSGQIKEYDEEHFYGEIGEAHHRHLSQLVALMPGETISQKTPAFLDSAKETLRLRGDFSTGWALAHRLCSMARVKDGNHAYLLLQNLLKDKTHPNLWDVHPPFQIDGNFGAVAGMTEMLLQSDNDTIYILPAIPKEWKNISFSGLKARGNFTVSLDYKDNKINLLKIASNMGESVSIFIYSSKNVKVYYEDSKMEVKTKIKDNCLHFDTVKGKTYIVENFELDDNNCTIENLISNWQDDGVCLEWKGKNKQYAIYRAVGNDKDYTELIVTDNCKYIDRQFSSLNKCRLTYKVIGFDKEKPASFGSGKVVFMHPASKLEIERYKMKFETNNINAKTL